MMDSFPRTASIRKPRAWGVRRKMPEIYRKSGALGKSI
jgi:hypothetical protein